MFKHSNRHKQRDIFDWETHFPNQGKLLSSIWHLIRTEVFEKVDQDSFSALYPSSTGRPNSPINEIVTLLTIKELFDWSFRELEEQMDWNIGVQYACGATVIEPTITRRTITNFIRTLREYQDKTGIDLFNHEFNRLVTSQLTRFKVNTKYARTDSTQISTNVCAYNRLQIQIEAIKRLYRVIQTSDREFVFQLVPEYISNEADNYVDMLRSDAMNDEFQKVGKCYLSMIKHFGDRYTKTDEWQMFMRIFEEQFVVEEDDDEPTISIKPSLDKSSDDIRAIDDPEATLRYKQGVHHLGYVGNVIETADPEADLNLICDVTLCANNVSDGPILLDRIDSLVSDRLTDLCEIHYDGGYGGPIVDAKLAQYSINSVQTGIRGVKCSASMQLEKCGDEYFLTCSENQRVKCSKRRKGYNASFDPSVCVSCKSYSICPVKKLEKTNKHVYYMSGDDLLKRLRLSYINTIPKKRRSIRSGVEATIRQFKCRTKAGKTRLRGLYRHKLWFALVALAINIKRIHEYGTGAPKEHNNRQLSRRFLLLCVKSIGCETLWNAVWCKLRFCRPVFCFSRLVWEKP